jgi:hypothetical protein
MVLPSTGSISMSQVNTEIQAATSTTQIDFNNSVVRSITGTSSSSALILPTNFYGASYGPTAVDYLVVAGGGGAESGGGGGGGMISGSMSVSGGSTYNTGVGGGAGQGGQGGGSSLTNAGSTTGGGFGGRGQEGGSPGGSGGGGGYGNGGRGGGGSIPGQGNNGGSGTCFPGQGCYGGGGGGKNGGGTGANYYPNPPRPGGAGAAWSDGITYSGGGAGGNNASNVGSPGGGYYGRGGWAFDDTTGRPGVVAVRYPNTKGNFTSTTGSPTFSDTGGYKYYYWYGAGSFTV